MAKWSELSATERARVGAAGLLAKYGPDYLKERARKAAAAMVGRYSHQERSAQARQSAATRHRKAATLKQSEFMRYQDEARDRAFMLLPVGGDYLALVDAEDYPSLAVYKWYIAKGAAGFLYAARADYSTGRQRTIRMHRVVTNAPDAMLVHHVNHDTLDNRKANLQLCTTTEHGQYQRPALSCGGSKPGYGKGYFFDKSKGKYRAAIRVGGRAKYLGIFATEDQAAGAVAAWRSRSNG